MSNPEPTNVPPPSPSMQLVIVAPLERFFLILGLILAVWAGFSQGLVTALLVMILATVLAICLGVWRVASYVIGLIKDLAPAFRRLRQLNLI